MLAEHTLQGIIEGVTVRGKADRIDAGRGNSAVIIDYKTGAVDKQSLQLPLYMGFLPKGYTAAGAFYLSLKPGSLKMHEVKPETVPEAFETAGEIIKKIKQGKVAPNPCDLKVCRYCVAQYVCAGGGSSEED